MSIGLRPADFDGKTLVFSSDLRQDYRLLEVDEEVLQDIILSRVVVKGRSEDEAVLCTESATYAVKSVETTNTVLLIGDHAGNVTSHGKASSHLELLRTAPRTHTLEALLQDATYDDGDSEGQATHSPSASRKRGFTFQELLREVQASAEELRAALHERGAIELDGVWRRVEETYLGELLEVVLLTAVVQGWPFQALPCTDMATCLQADGYDPRIVQHCLMLHSTEEPGAPCPESVSLCNTKICRYFARKLFKTKTRWYVSEFMEQWKGQVPEGFAPQESMLRGEGLVEEVAGARILNHFPVSGLPEEPAERFRLLFAARPQWTRAELEPYLQGLQVANKLVEAVLLAHTRSQTDHNGVVHFTAR
eukprot:jgi/Botrbrau1/9370/Bobra.354_2s0025.1